ncbi:MAG: hypothetical protein KF864_05470 [Phycisphaeraceae bacterium]|nr:hypothetical protein [Phycisphaeraceae bacterium]
MILRDRDTDEPWTSASDGALEERRFYCQNWRADVVAVTRSDGAPWEFVRYSAYGEPTVYPLADVNRDGVVNLDDLTAFGMGTTTGDFAATPDGEPDLDFDGDIGSSADIALFMDSDDANTGQNGKGRVSSAEMGNRKGYAGYEWDHVIAMSHVRHRVYWAEIGRWTRRDPLGYVDGMSLYELVGSTVVSLVDPYGLNGEWPTWLRRDITLAELEAERAKIENDETLDKKTKARRLAEIKKAKKLIEQNSRIQQKAPGVRHPKGRRGFIGRGTAISLLFAGVAILDSSSELLSGQTERGQSCRRYFNGLADAVESGDCNILQMNRDATECSQDILTSFGSLGPTASASFDEFHKQVQAACEEARQKKAEEDSNTQSQSYSNPGC